MNCYRYPKRSIIVLYRSSESKHQRMSTATTFFTLSFCFRKRQGNDTGSLKYTIVSMSIFTCIGVGIMCVGCNLCIRFCVCFPLSVYTTKHVSRFFSLSIRSKLYTSQHLTIWARLEYSAMSILIQGDELFE